MSFKGDLREETGERKTRPPEGRIIRRLPPETGAAGGPAFHLGKRTPFDVRVQKGLGDRIKQSKLHYPQDLIDYCTHFRTESRNPSFDRDVALSHLAGLIELSVHRTVGALGMNLVHDQSRQRLTDVLKTIESYIETSFSVEDLARLAGTSPSRLYRQTQRYFGKSPGALIEEIRIRHARELLLHSNHKLDKIAEMTGYSDAFTFSRAFKRITGTPPSTFRRELR